MHQMTSYTVNVSELIVLNPNGTLNEKQSTERFLKLARSITSETATLAAAINQVFAKAPRGSFLSSDFIIYSVLEDLGYSIRENEEEWKAKKNEIIEFLRNTPQYASKRGASGGFSLAVPEFVKEQSRAEENEDEKPARVVRRREVRVQ